MTSNIADRDYVRVTATPEERAEWQARPQNEYRTGTPYRVACRHCGKRYWLSGLAVVSHRRHCATQPFSDQDECRVCGSHIPESHLPVCCTFAARRQLSTSA